ncbi:MAG: peptide MFS transporter [Planctomycetes bacterium]|nr:peptide MFS transporter [Planctomycetota bacterium]
MTSENPQAADLDPRLAAIRNFEGKYPRQLWGLFLSEMWERFCFYGMRGALTVFMISQLGMLEKEANLRYGAIQAFVYTMTFVGGFFADQILGFRRSIAWGGLLMAAGSFTIAASPQDYFWIGTSISIIGTGFFKPNISGIVGHLYHDGDTRRDAGFSLFYSGINIGAFLGGLICVGLGKNYGWHWTFVSTGVVMLFGLFVFGLTARGLEPLGHSPLIQEGQRPSTATRIKLISVYVGSLAMIPLIRLLVEKSEYTDPFMWTVGPLVLVYFIITMLRCPREELRKLVAALVLILFSIAFWGIYEQSGGSLAIVAENHLPPADLIVAEVDALGINNSSNALFVIVFSPLVGLIWLFMGKRQPSDTSKFAIGFFFLAAAYYLFQGLGGAADANGMSSIALFTFAYFVVTIGEICLSPIGLSAMTKLAPRRMYGIIMGMWFLASAYGQYVAGLLGASMATEKAEATPYEKLMGYADGYGQLAFYSLICGVALLLLAPVLNRLAHGKI